MLKEIILVALGGALGSSLRYGCTLGVDHLAWHPTIATLIVNVLGSFLIGMVISSSDKPTFTLFASVGFCGGFTTFSTFSSQNVRLLQQSLYGQAFTYMGSTLVLCFLATWIGIMLGQRIHNA